MINKSKQSQGTRTRSNVYLLINDNKCPLRTLMTLQSWGELNKTQGLGMILLYFDELKRRKGRERRRNTLGKKGGIGVRQHVTYLECTGRRLQTRRMGWREQATSFSSDMVIKE